MYTIVRLISVYSEDREDFIFSFLFSIKSFTRIALFETVFHSDLFARSRI